MILKLLQYGIKIGSQKTPETPECLSIQGQIAEEWNKYLCNLINRAIRLKPEAVIIVRTKNKSTGVYTAKLG